MSRKLIYYSILALSVLACRPGFSKSFVTDGQITPCFTPGGACANLIVQEIDRAKEKVLVQAYSFTSAPIARAMVQAKKRGVQIEVILDKGQVTAKYSSADFVSHAGIPTFIDRKHAIAHNKIILIDDATVITGSFNFTKAAQEKNAENLLVIKSAALAEIYTENWREHVEHSEKYLKVSLD